MSTKKSKNYEWFKFLSNNRKLSKKHLANLRRQFEDYGNITEISPITVNKAGFIIDGQHRFALCQELNMPVYYNEVEVRKEITPAINSNQKRWSAIDYIEFFAAYNKEYRMLSEFINKNETSYYVASSTLFPSNSSSSVLVKLQKGELEVSPVIEEAQKRMDIINEVNDIMGQQMTERYARGLLRCLDMESFDVNRFITKLKRIVQQGRTYVAKPRATTTADVLHNIETIYNFHTRDNNTVLLFR